MRRRYLFSIVYSIFRSSRGKERPLFCCSRCIGMRRSRNRRKENSYRIARRNGCISFFPYRTSVEFVFVKYGTVGLYLFLLCKKRAENADFENKSAFLSGEAYFVAISGI